jgi:hypothetical protein
LAKAAMESAHETGMVSVTDNVRHFFDLHVRGGQQPDRHRQPALAKQVADVDSSLILEQTLEMGWAQMDLLRQLAHAVGQMRFNAL